MSQGGKPAVLRCSRCGRFVDWTVSRLQVVCDCRPRLDLPPVLVREASETDRRRAMDLFYREYGAGQLVAGGQAISLDDAPALVAEVEQEIAGALAWRHSEGALHILALATDPMWQRSGVGGYLVAEAELLARRNGRKRVVVTITNDNIPAMYFYQRRGYRLAAILADSVAAHTAHEAPIGFAGIEIRDEVQLVKTL